MEEYEGDGEDLLDELLLDAFEAAALEEMAPATRPAYDHDLDPEPEVAGKKPKSLDTHSQWALGGNNRFSPVGATVKTVPAGIYTLWSTPGAWGLELQSVSSDGIYTLPDMATEEVLKDIYKFWDSEQKYRDHSLLYRRGIILWGSPGAGKSIAVKILMNELVNRGGIVLIIQHVGLAIEALKAIRRIEPKRHIIAVFEDIDEIIYTQGEANVLSMLDGEANVDCITNLATTNYPEKLGARIINRPSRFDRRVFVPMPSDAARMSYFKQATKEGLSVDELSKWVEDSKNMSIAHLRELVAAVYCLEQPYPEVIERLKDMAKQVEGETGFGPRRKISFGAQPSGTGGW